MSTDYAHRVTAPLAAAGRPHSREWDELTEAEQVITRGILVQLGTADGERTTPHRQPADRAALITDAATILGIAVTPGHDLVQCAECAAVLDGAQATTHRDVIRCTNLCHPQAMAEADPDTDTGPDRTYYFHDYEE